MSRDFSKVEIRMASKDVKICYITSHHSVVTALTLRFYMIPAKMVTIVNISNSEY